MFKFIFRYLMFAVLSLAGSVVLAQSVDRIETGYIIRNQGETALCWLHSMMQMMEQMAGQPLSIDAILISELQSRALTRFLGYETPWDEGSGPTRPFALALEHGLVPEAVWKPKESIVENYANIHTEIEKILESYRGRDVEEFLRQVNTAIMRVTGTMPPTNFKLGRRATTAVQYAARVIGKGDSVGWDFRDIPYSDRKFKRIPPVAWATIMSRDHKLVQITDVIKKVVHRVTADEAFDRAVQIFSEKRPVAFTFIYWDADIQYTFKVNDRNEFEALRPAVTDAYTSSHLVLVTGVVRDRAGHATGLEILDSLDTDRNGGTRTVTREFFNTHGKTVHEIVSRDCIKKLRP